MATFLQLVNDVERESGTIAQSQRLTTVAGATGRQEKIVAWTRQAWEMIQRDRGDWHFRRKQFSANLTAGTTSYSSADLSLTDFAGWGKAAEGFEPFTIFDPAVGRGDETHLVVIPFRSWLEAYDVGVPDRYRPNVIAMGFDRKIHVGPPPEKVYTLRGWYKREIQALTADDDVPYIDDEFHQAIVWKALMLLAEDDEAQFEIATSGRAYEAIYSRMVAEYVDQPWIG